MGDNKQLFPIPAYIELDGNRFKVLKVGLKGLLLEEDPILLELLKEKDSNFVVVNFILPYDGFNELVLPRVKLKCFQEEESGLLCRFVELQPEHEELFRALVRNFLWRRIISIPSEFMNYTQDETVRKELLSIEKKLKTKKRLKILAALTLLTSLGALLSVVPKLWSPPLKEKPSLVVRYESKKEEAVPKLPPKVEEVKVEEVQRKRATPESKPEELSLKELISQVKTQAEKAPPQEPPKTLSRDKDYYCIQVATDVEPNALIKKAEKIKQEYTRVERIGKLYTLRVGFWSSYKEAKEKLPPLKSSFKDAFIRKCAYRPERWLYPLKEGK